MIDAVVWFWTEALPQWIDMTGKVSAVLFSIVLATALVYYVGSGILLLIRLVVALLQDWWRNR